PGRTVATRCPRVPAISLSCIATNARVMTGAAVSSAIRMAPTRRKSGRAMPARSGTADSTAGPTGGRSSAAVGSGVPGMEIMQRAAWIELRLRIIGIRMRAISESGLRAGEPAGGSVQAVLQVDGLRVHYDTPDGRLEVLRDLSFGLRQGEIGCLLGP